MPLGRIEHDAKLTLARAGPRYELGERRVDAEARVLQVDRVDRVLGDRYFDARLADHPLAAEADDAGQAAARPAFDDAVEIHEADSFTLAVGMGDAGTQPAG